MLGQWVSAAPWGGVAALGVAIAGGFVVGVHVVLPFGLNSLGLVNSAFGREPVAALTFWVLALLALSVLTLRPPPSRKERDRMTRVLALEGVSKSFRGVPLLTSVDLELLEGECLALSGPNGSGKSVLFRLACRLAVPDAGRVAISPKYLHPKRTFPQSFGVIIDRPGYVASRTGLDNLLELASIRSIVGEQEVREAMGMVGLDPETPQAVGRYSLGMKQKLALAQAFMEGQQVLLLDEPFNALDEKSVVRTRDILRRFLNEGRTIMFASHNADDVAALSTRHVRIQDGRVVPAT